MPAGLLSFVRFAHARRCDLLRYAALMGAICLSAAAHAQTAQFSYAIQTPGGGFSSPAGVALDSSGNIYVADTANSAVKEIPSGCTASSCVITLGGGFNQPSGIAVDSSGTIYVADTQNSAIKKMNSDCTSSNCVVTLGGGFQSPHGVAVDGSGFVYVADTANNTIEQMASTCTSALYSAGSCSITSLGGNFFNGPEGVAVDSSGNVYVADTFNSAVEEMPPNCTSQTCIMALFALDTSSIINNGGGFNRPSGVAVDPSGNVYVADTQYTSLDKLTPNCHSSSCRTSVGSGFNMPQGVAVDGKGNLYVADTGNSAVKEFATTAVALPATAVGQSSQSATLTFTFTAGGHINHLNVVTQGAASLDFTDALTGTCDTNQIFHLYSVGDTCTVVVNFTPQYPGLRQGTVQLVSSSGSIIGSALVYGIGTGPQMVFNAPLTASALGGGYHNAQGIAVDGSGNVYVADVLNNAVKEVPSGCTSSSCVSTLGGGFTNPFGVAHDGGYNVYVADEGNNAVKEIPSGCTSSSCVLTLGGGFSSPNDVALDGSGNVYVADGGNNAVKEIPVGCSSSSCVLTLGGGFSSPYGVALDGSGNVYVADYGNNAVKEIPVGCTSSSCVLTLGGGFSVPRKVAVDAGGEVYVADSGHSLVKVVPAGCASSSCVSTLVSGFNSPEGVALDGAGNLYVSDTLNEALKKFDRFDAPSFTFATGTTIGTMDTTDGTQTATLANIGNQALTFPVPSSGFNPSFPSGFLYDSSSTCAQLATSSSAATLAVGASCTLGIDFQPTAAGTNSGSVVFTDTSLNAASATQSIAVSGTGLKQTPTVTVSPAVSYYGTTSVTLSAAVAFNGTTLPTGAFTFQVGSGTAFAATCTGTSSPLTCTASDSTGSLAAGSYTITGSIAADTNFLSASNTATLTVTTNASNPETESVLWNFASSSGDQSESSLIQASDGNFYGTTFYGGTCTVDSSGCGTVFQITPSGTYTVIHTFTGSDGANPAGAPVQGTDGNLYGITYAGTVFKISIASPYAFTLMHTFSSSEGAALSGGLTQGNDGNFYGTAFSGGANSDGTVFEISPTSPYTLTVLHSFAGGTTDGKNPQGGLVQGTDGNFYGTTTAGGSGSAGIVFKISPVSPYTFTLMHSFAIRRGTSEGERPDAGLVQGTDGSLYGTTQLGGLNSAGTVFKISPTSPYTESVVHSFSNVSTDGYQPLAGLVEGSDGNFYGTTNSAGANGVGLAYSISPSSPYTLSLLHSFANATTDGNDPQSGLVQGADGNFYGTTYSGGTNSLGVIYKMTPTSTLAAPVSLSAPASVSAGASFTMSYAVLNAPPAGAAVGTLQQCFATNTAGDTTGWTGVKTGYTTTTNASLTAPSTPGTYTYTLTCGGMESNAVTVTVPALATFGSMSFSPAATEPQGTSVAVTISDTVTYNSAQPTGAVTFVLNGTTYTATCTTTGSPETCSATVPAATIAALTRNSYTVTASLAADSNYTATTGTSGTFTVIYPISYSAPTEPVGTASAAQTATVQFSGTFTVGSVSVLTLGATGLDFNPATGGTCADGFSATPSTTCTVKYTFTPKFAGSRYGAIVVKDTSGNTQATIYLNGTGTGPQAVFNAPLTAAVLGGGFSGPFGVAADGSGNVYVADAFNNAVKEIPSGCTTSSCVLTLVGGFGAMSGIAVDGGGNVYVTDDDAVKQIPAGCTSLSCVTTLGGGFDHPHGVAVDGSGNVYVSDTFSLAIKVMPSGCASSSCVTTLTTTALPPGYIAVDGSGNVYFDLGSYLTQQISEIPVGCASSSCVTAVGAGFMFPNGIAVDASGNIYVADQNDNALKVMAASCTSSSCVTTLATGFNIVAGVALDGGGNIYVADSNKNVVAKLDRVDAPTLTFATATPVGSTDTTDGQQTVTLANIGTSALTLSSLSAGDTNANFSGAATTCATSSPLAAGASCNLGVVFAPSSVGNPLTGSAVVTDNSLNNPSATQSVSVSGVSTALTATLGTLSFSPAATEPQGTSVAVTLSDTLTYSYARPTGAVTFVLNGTTYTATCTTTGSPETCSATVPAATIVALGVNTYTVTAALAADSVYAAATGTSGTFTIASSGSSGALIEPIGTASPVQTATISFTSTFTVGSVNVLTLGAKGLDFNPASGGTCANGFSATPSTTCTVNYTFTPKYAGPRFGAITIADGSGVTQATVYLSGTGTGPQAVFTPGTTSLVGGTYGFYEPNAAAVDGSGNVYVADTYNFQVEKIPAGCTTSTCVITLGGFNQNAGNEPAGIAVDGSGQVYVADMNTNTVTVMAPTCTKSSCVTQLGGGFSSITRSKPTAFQAVRFSAVLD
jgi:uncharacterized repeat protein (TIGR03803 family)